MDNTLGQWCQGPWTAHLLQESIGEASPLSGRETQPKGTGINEMNFGAPNTGLFVADPLGEGNTPVLGFPQSSTPGISLRGADLGCGGAGVTTQLCSLQGGSSRALPAHCHPAPSLLPPQAPNPSALRPPSLLRTTVTNTK